MKLDSSVIVLSLNLLCCAFLASKANCTENIGPKLKTLGYCAEANELASGGYALWQDIHKELGEAEAEINDGVPPAKLAKKLGQCVIKTRILARNCGPLIEMGEPSGFDLKYRVQTLNDRLTVIRNSDFGNYLKPLAKQQYQANQQRVSVTLQKIRKSASKNQFEKAEKQLNVLLDSINGYGFFLQPKYQQTLWPPIALVEQPIRSKMSKIRRERWNATLTKKYQSLLPDIEVLSKQVKDVSKDISSSGVATIGSQQLTGPETLKQLVDGYRSAHLRLVRAKGVAVAMRNKELIEKTDGLIGKLKTDLLSGFPAIIEGDAERLSQDQIKSVYFEYMRKLLPLAMKIDGGDLVEICETSLNKLASKDSQFALEIAAYRDATSDLLRWRRKVAKSKASKHEEFKDVERVLQEKLVAVQGFKGLGVIENVGAPSILDSGLNEIYPVSRDRLQGTKVRLSHPVDFGKNWFKSISDRHWVVIKQSTDFQLQVDALRNDLMASTELPPLTLNSAKSLATANSKHLLAVGGAITDAKLEALAVRLAKLPEKGSVLVPIGNKQKFAGLDQLLVQLEVTPSWIEHEHFFVDFAAE